ncbi:MAG TPA: 50S ribosomal protein L11 methyltransferase [Rhodocyclaceae bacterium]|nr:MAG: 50S ribosomal protein L11 methyltransferase [Rhodocyclales bacterium CG_4_9_14_3_um_filter_68_10]HCX32300.1 50S ribosomal protein L11 methyltransferase [Rhodocyclaceae bacterium]
MWLSVVLATDAGHAEALSEALLARGALCVSVEDADAGTAREVAQFAEPGAPAAALWSMSRLDVLLDSGTDVGRTLTEAATEAGLGTLPDYTVTELEEQDWVRLARDQFVPIRIGERLWIVPSWATPPDPRAVNIILDPGLAFGTGSHATTHLCLEWLLEHAPGASAVLDYGCGSGILAVAAARLGARRVLAVDIDDQALRAAAGNAARNEVSIELAHSSRPIEGEFDLVVANILARPLQLLAPLLCARLAPGGRLALSGVLEAQAGSLCEAYRPWLSLSVGATREGWVRLEGIRP